MNGRLQKNQYVVFPNGERHGWLEARWSEKEQAYYTFVENEDGENVRLYSTEVITKERKSKRKFVPSEKTCTVEIHPCGESEKAYCLYDGSNGHVGRGLRHYYKYVAKSICYVKDGRIYAPPWA